MGTRVLLLSLHDECTVNETVALVTGIIGCATSVVSIAPRFREPLGKCYRNLAEKLSYMHDTENNLQTLHEQALNLEGNIDDSIIRETREFCKSVRDEDIYCLWCVPNYYKRYPIGKRTAELMGRLKELGGQLKQTNTDDLLDLTISRRLVGSQPEAALGEIKNSINSHQNSIIGVFGPRGIGKTSVVESFCVGDAKLIWVEASYGDDLKMLQMKLARKIGLRLSSDDNVVRNSDLVFEYLVKKKGFLIVLDNLWKTFPLAEIGILTRRCGRNVILISRSSSVCSQMGAEKIIEMKPLSDEEACELLRLHAQDYIGSNLSDETTSLLKDLAKECGGLPLTIKMVARHLRKLKGKDSVTIEKTLKNQLDAFRESAGNSEYIHDKVFENFVLEHKQLKKSTQECFLWCTIYPRNTSFVAKDLMEYWLWEGLFGEVERIDKKLTKAEEILDELKDAHLLDSTGHENGVEIVKLHPFIWDMAVKMIKEKSEFFIKAGSGLRKPLYGDWPENVERVSLIRNKIKELRSGPVFGKLSTLLLQFNPIDLPIQEAFFNCIPNLKVLDLSNTGVRILPSSLSCLKNLITLLLRNCWALTNLPSLSELLALIVLDISGSPVAQLPCDISSQLMRLDLSRTRVTNLSHSLLTKLYNLQELLMIGCDFPWISQSLKQDDSKACIKDVEELEYLSVLEITFSKMQTFHDYIRSKHWCRLKSFKFCVGGLYNGKLGNNSLAFINEFPSDPILLPDKTSELLVMHCGDVTHLTIPTFQHLKIMDVSYCAKLKYLIKLEYLQHLPNLEEMVITHCPDMEMVIEKDDVGTSLTDETIILPRLQRLTLFSLPQLQFFSRRKIKCDSLQTIAVWNCSELQAFPIVLLSNDSKEALETPKGLKEVIGESSWFEALEQDPSDILPILQKLFVPKSPPEVLISRGRMMAPSDS